MGAATLCLQFIHIVSQPKATGNLLKQNEVYYYYYHHSCGREVSRNSKDRGNHGSMAPTTTPGTQKNLELVQRCRLLWDLQVEGLNQLLILEGRGSGGENVKGIANTTPT